MLHVVVPSWEMILYNEACLDALSSGGVDRSEETSYREDEDEEDDHEPESVFRHSVVEDGEGQDDWEDSDSDEGDLSKVSHGGLEALEMRAYCAEFLAFSAWVAIGGAEQVDVGVGVGSDESEDGWAAAAGVIAAVTALTTAGSRVADEQLSNDSW